MYTTTYDTYKITDLKDDDGNETCIGKRGIMLMGWNIHTWMQACMYMHPNRHTWYTCIHGHADIFIIYMISNGVYVCCVLTTHHDPTHILNLLSYVVSRGLIH